MVDLDEAWTFLQVAQGKALSNKLIRAGRSMNAAVYFVTQNSGDVDDEKMKNNIGLKFAFRSTDIKEIKNTLSAERGKKPFRFSNFNLKGGEIMKPSSFENAIRLQFDCLARKVIGRTVKNYNKELARRAKHEISFCEIPELELNQLGVSDEYPIEFTSFDVFGTEVRVYDEKLCEAIKKLSERRRNVVLMFYFLELPDAEIAEILDISRNSVYRNRMCSLKLIRDMYEEEL